MSSTIRSQPLPFPKLHKHTGQAFVRWQGKPKYFGKFGTDDANRKYWKWVAELAGGKVPAGVVAVCLVSDLFRLYREHHGDMDRAQRSRLNNLEEFDGLHRFSTSEYGPLLFQEHRRQLLATGTRSARQVNDLMQLCQRIFRWGVSKQMVTLETWQALKLVERLKPHESPKQTKRRVPVPASVVAATLPYLSTHCADMVRLIVATGARPGEILSLRADEVVREYQHREDRAGWWYAEKTKHKTSNKDKKRWVEFPPGECHEILLRRWPADGGFFFPATYDFGYYRVASLKQHIHHVCDAMDLPRWGGSYGLRHLKLTDIACKEGVARASEAAGHSGLRITDTYIHEPPRRTA